MKKMFGNPFEVFTTIAGNSAEITKNNLKFHKACIAYNQSIIDMMESIDANAKIMNGENEIKNNR